MGVGWRVHQLFPYFSLFSLNYIRSSQPIFCGLIKNCYYNLLQINNNNKQSKYVNNNFIYGYDR